MAHAPTAASTGYTAPRSASSHVVSLIPIALGWRRGHSTKAAAKDAAASTVTCAAYRVWAASASGPAAAQAAVAAKARHLQRRDTGPRAYPTAASHKSMP